MKLSDVIFADGRITDCIIREDTAHVHLVDYMENRLSIQFLGAVLECEAENFGCSVHHHKLNKSADTWALELFDDDNERILSARFASAEVIGPLAP